MRKESSFIPPWWLSNRHLQTFWSPLSAKLPIPKLSRQRIELADGDFLDCDWVNPNRDAPTVILLHGLEGNLDSPYLRRMLVQIHKKRWRGLLVYWRGCSENMNRLDQTYHAGRSEDLQAVMEFVKSKELNQPLFIAGYSLGANVLLKWLGEQQTDANIEAAFAVSTPFDLELCAESIDRGFSKIYKHYLLNCLKKKMLIKFSPERLLQLLNLTPKDLLLISSIQEFDQRVNARLNGFASAKDYYEKSSCKFYLKDIKVPAVILHAEDDPFMSPEVIPSEDQLSDFLELRVSKYGGHVGFVQDPKIKAASFYLENSILDYFEQFL